MSTRTIAGAWPNVGHSVLPPRVRRRRRPRARSRCRAVDSVIETVGLDQVINRIVTHFGPEPLMVALDALTAPQRVAAE